MFRLIFLIALCTCACMHAHLGLIVMCTRVRIFRCILWHHVCDAECVMWSAVMATNTTILYYEIFRLILLSFAFLWVHWFLNDVHTVCLVCDFSDDFLWIFTLLAGRGRLSFSCWHWYHRAYYVCWNANHYNFWSECSVFVYPVLINW